MLAKWSIITAGGVIGAALGVWLLDDWLWWLLFNYDNVLREKQIAFTIAAVGGMVVGGQAWRWESGG